MASIDRKCGFDMSNKCFNVNLITNYFGHFMCRWLMHWSLGLLDFYIKCLIKVFNLLSFAFSKFQVRIDFFFHDSALHVSPSRYESTVSTWKTEGEKSSETRFPKISCRSERSLRGNQPFKQINWLRLYAKIGSKFEGKRPFKA